MKRHFLSVTAIAAAIFLSSCEKPKPPVPPVSVTVTPVVQHDVLATNQWVGLLDGFQNTNIQAQVAGYLLTQNYKEGSAVKKGALLVPQAATVEMQGIYFVTIVEADNSFHSVPVKLGPVQGELQVVEGKISAGDKVVVGGIEKALPGAKLVVSAYVAPTPPPTHAATPAESPVASPSPAAPVEAKP